jgi:hypothetical protein
MTEQNGHRPAKVLRVIAVTLMGIAVAFTLLAGVGTTCVAFAENCDSMAALVPFKPLYQALVVIGLAVGIWGIPLAVPPMRGGQKTYRNALLVLGAVSAGVHVALLLAAVSRRLLKNPPPSSPTWGMTARMAGWYTMAVWGRATEQAADRVVRPIAI